tara:strand:- start:147 stop:764 length:618 start_codon:yes stop_codon:yes gene_type:complete
MKKKMMYGGKVKKMAVGGTTREPDKIKDLGPNKGTKRTKGRRIVDKITDEIFKLSQSKSNATPAQIKEINKRIAEKRAAIKANNPIDKKTGKALNIGEIAAGIDFPETFGKNVRYDARSTIPTKTGTFKDTITKSEMGIEARDLLNKEKQREKKAGGTIKKKAGGSVKKMKGGGMAMKYKHGGTVGKKSKKCPRDGIAMRGKTRA